MLTEVNTALFSDYCTGWLEQQEETVRPSSYAKYYGIVEKHIKPALGDCQLSELSTDWIAQLAQQKTVQENLSARTVQAILVVLRSILDYAQEETAFDFSGIEMPYPKLSREKKQALSIEEQEKLMRFLVTDMDCCKFGIFLSLMAGLQIGELCALQWNDISIPERTITAAHTMQRVQNFAPDAKTKTIVQIGPSKRKPDEQKIPLTKLTAAYCVKFRQEDVKSFVLTGTRDSMEPRTLQYRFKKYMTVCGLPQVHFETLRYGFSTRCIDVDFEMGNLRRIAQHNIRK